MKKNFKLKNRLKGLSLFANVGIAETYLSEVGVDIVVANEWLPERAKFYQHLYPDCHMVCGDITSDEVYDSIIAEAREQDVEFVMATPPCQGMSIAGKDDPHDPRNYLVAYAVNAIRDLRPKYAFMENVFMQLQTTIRIEGKDVLIPDLVDAILGGEYYIEKEVIDTKFYGVPQQRKRAIMLLARKDVSGPWNFPPKEKHIVTLKEAIGDLPSLDPKVKEKEFADRLPDYEKKRKAGLSVSKWHYATGLFWRNIEVMMHTPTGKSARQNPVYFPKKKDGTMVGGAPRTYMRMDWDKPSPTITAQNGSATSFQTIHPGRPTKQRGIYSDARVLSIYELMIVMSLPKDWKIPDWAPDSLIREVIGEGVPPLAVKKIVAVLGLGKK